MTKSILLIVAAGLIVTGCATKHQARRAPAGPIPGPSAQAAAPYAVDTSRLAPEPSGNAVQTESTAQSATIDALTIDEALRLAENNRPDLEAFRRRIGMAEGEAQQAGLWPNPTLTVGFEGYTPGGDDRPPDLTALDNLVTFSNRARDRFATVRGILAPDAPALPPAYEFWVPGIPEPRDPDQLQQIVSIAQPLPIWGTPRLARNAGRLEAQRRRHEYERAVLNARTEVNKAFAEVIFQQNRLATTLELEQTLSGILDVTRARLQSGDIAEVEVIKGEADLERFALEVESAKTELGQAKFRLARAIGSPALTVQTCTDTTPRLPDPPDAELVKLHPEHPQVRVWAAIREAAEAQVDVAESRRWPVPKLDIGYRHYEFTDQDTLDLSLEFELPLFDRKQGEIRAAREKAVYETAAAESEKHEMEALLRQTVLAFASHRRQAKAYEERILPRMEESLSIARSRFDAGDTSMLDVLDAYRSLAESKLAYHRALFETWTAFHELDYLLAEQPQHADR